MPSMQQVKYFKEQICDELKGACDYLKKAIVWQKTRSEWAKTFYEMAEAEEKHATNLYKMFMQLYSENQGVDSYMTQIRDMIMDCFSTEMRKIEDCKAAYMIMVGSKNENTQSASPSSIMPQKGSAI